MICKAGLALIREFESLRLSAYPDPGTRSAPWTIGYGHTGGVREGDTCTTEQAEAWLLEDVAEAEKCIDAWVDVDLTEAQRGALASWIFNLGCEQFKASTLLRCLNAGNFLAIPAQIRRWTRANGVIMPGLVRRRDAEAELFVASAH
jgi:lysozyme